MIPFPAFVTTFLRIFSRIAPSITEVDAIVFNGAKNILGKGTPTFISGPANLPKKAPRYPPD